MSAIKKINAREIVDCANGDADANGAVDQAVDHDRFEPQLPHRVVELRDGFPRRVHRDVGGRRHAVGVGCGEHGASGAAVAAAGRVNVKRLPLPGSLSASMRPP